MITIIAAASDNDVIGNDNKLIWHLSKDLIRFKNLTKGHHVIMGRKTFESMPKAAIEQMLLYQEIKIIQQKI